MLADYFDAPLAIFRGGLAARNYQFSGAEDKHNYFGLIDPVYKPRKLLRLVFNVSSPSPIAIAFRFKIVCRSAEATIFWTVIWGSQWS